MPRSRPAIAGFTNLTLLDGGIAPDTIAGDGVYTVSFLVPTNLATCKSACGLRLPAGPMPPIVSYPVVFPPPNDNFANRIAISTSPCQTTVTGSNLNASKEAGRTRPRRPARRAVGLVVLDGAVHRPGENLHRRQQLRHPAGRLYRHRVSNLSLVAANNDAERLRLVQRGHVQRRAGPNTRSPWTAMLRSKGQIVLGVLPLTLRSPWPKPWTPLLSSSPPAANAPWLGQNCLTHDGTDAARSGPIEANGKSWLQTTVTGAGLVHVLVEGVVRGQLGLPAFYLDGAEQKPSRARWTGSRIVRGWGSAPTLSAGPTSRTSALAPARTPAGWMKSPLITANSAIPPQMGDLDGDGQPTVLDLTLLIGYLRDTNSLRPQVAVFADVNSDGLINSNDIPAAGRCHPGPHHLAPGNRHRRRRHP